jgi:hypothetical protein
MKLYQINENGNTYCGPAVISAVAGIGTKEAAAIIRSKFGLRTVRATSLMQVHYALDMLGFGLRNTPCSQRRPTVANWAKDTARGKDVWLVDNGSHWILVQGRYALCSKTDGLVPVADHPNARSFVRNVYQIYRLRNVAAETVIPTKSRTDISEAGARRQVKKLAAAHGIEIERDSPDTSIWVWPPKAIKRQDPYEEHYVDYWSEALTRVREYVKLIATSGRPTDLAA